MIIHYFSLLRVFEYILMVEIRILDIALINLFDSLTANWIPIMKLIVYSNSGRYGQPINVIYLEFGHLF